MTKIIHRAWFGPIPMPERYRRYGEQLQEMNPDWEYRLWTEADILALGLRNRAVWDDISANGGVTTGTPRSYESARATQLADVMGYELIYNFGGVYLNCDMEPLRPLDQIPVEPDEAWACDEGGGWVNNGAIGGPPGHQFWGYVIEQLGLQWPSRKGRPMEQATGPWLLTEARAVRRGLTVLEPRYFHYAAYYQVAPGGDASAFRQAALDAGAIVLHHWGHHAQEMQ